MYPFIRLAKTLAKSSIATFKGDNLSITDTAHYDFVVHLGDIDNYLEMNNGRIFTVFDLARTDFAIRTGLGKKLLKQRWGLVVAGSTIQYRKRIRAFDKVTIQTRICGIDSRWFYIEQTMWIKGICHCHALLRTGVTNFSTGKVIKTDIVLDALGYVNMHIEPDEWVQAWIDADKLRPFPNTNDNNTAK